VLGHQKSISSSLSYGWCIQYIPELDKNEDVRYKIIPQRYSGERTGCKMPSTMLWADGYYPRLKKEEGMEEYSQNFIFDIAQVILQPDEQRVVRLNEEVMALAKAKRKAAIKKAYNELVYEDEIEGILDFHLEITIIQTRWCHIHAIQKLMDNAYGFQTE
jgi:hypothetical protein